jgi:hypothetical protein
MKKGAIVLTILVVAAGIGLFLSKNKTASPTSNPPTQAAQDAAVTAALARQDTNTVAIIQSNFARVQPAPGGPASAQPAVSSVPAGQPAPLQFTNFDPGIVLENTARAIRQYGTMFGGNPVGINSEITSQLNGNNPKHINFINADQGMRVNENGELIDPWGTPYFFHQLSGTDMEIHSAGPDRIMWTADDLVTH